MKPRSFQELAAGVTVDTVAFAKAIQKSAAPTNFVIFFTPRSGSTWLTAVLSATDRLGYPEEYCNPAFIPDVARGMNAADPANFLAMLRRHRQSPNGVFGIEVLAAHVETVGEAAFFASLPHGTSFFMLWRRNIVAQAISLYRAVATGRFHSWEAEQPPPLYDAEAIRYWIKHVLAIENENLLILDRQGHSARRLVYEDITRSAGATQRRFARWLGVHLDPLAVASAPTKVSDAWNTAAQRRFRRENADFVSEISARRLVLAGFPRQGPKGHPGVDEEVALIRV